MILYHGTNIDFDAIDLSKCSLHKDFGQGFYLTDIKNQAERMAMRRSRRSGHPVVQAYYFDEKILTNSVFKVLRFEKPNENWAQFIFLNREQRNPPFSHPYDIVYGPVADDGVAYNLELYKEGKLTLSQIAKELEFKQLNNQYCFCTTHALETLTRTSI